MKTANTILIIDDDARNIFALKAVLKAKGFPVLSSLSMKDALVELNADKSIGLILLDMMMPDMDGYEAATFLKTHPQYATVPVIAVTAQAMKGDRERCLAAGVDAYLSKPVDVDALVALLTEYLT